MTFKGSRICVSSKTDAEFTSDSPSKNKFKDSTNERMQNYDDHHSIKREVNHESRELRILPVTITLQTTPKV